MFKIIVSKICSLCSRLLFYQKFINRLVNIFLFWSLESESFLLSIRCTCYKCILWLYSNFAKKNLKEQMWKSLSYHSIVCFPRQGFHNSFFSKFLFLDHWLDLSIILVMEWFSFSFSEIMINYYGSTEWVLGSSFGCSLRDSTTLDWWSLFLVTLLSTGCALWVSNSKTSETNNTIIRGWIKKTALDSKTQKLFPKN